MVTKRHILYAVFGFIAISAGIITVVFSIYQAKPRPTTRSDQRAATIGNRQQQSSAAHLYFADKDNLFLIAERRILRHTQDPINFSRKIVEALIKGPSDGFTRTIPQDTILRALYITAEGICYVDVSAEIKENHPGGVQSELLTLYSLVNSLILNIPEIQAVKILIDGHESMTLVGHIDLQEPLKANMLLIR